MAKRTTIKKQTQKESEKLSVVARLEWKTIFQKTLSVMKKAWGFLALALVTLIIALWSLLSIELPITKIYPLENSNEQGSITITSPRMISYGDPFSIIITINNPTVEELPIKNISIFSHDDFIYLNGTNQITFDGLDAFETKTDSVEMILLSKDQRAVIFYLFNPAASLQSKPIEFILQKTNLPFSGIATDALFLACLLFAYSYYKSDEPKPGKVISIIVLSLVLAIIIRFASQELKDLVNALTQK